MENGQGADSVCSMDKTSNASDEAMKNTVNAVRLVEKEKKEMMTASYANVLKTGLCNTVNRESLSENKVDKEKGCNEVLDSTSAEITGSKHVEMDLCDAPVVENIEPKLVHSETGNKDSTPTVDTNVKQNPAVMATEIAGKSSSDVIAENKADEMKNTNNGCRQSQVNENECGTSVVEGRVEPEASFMQTSESGIGIPMEYRSIDSGVAVDESSDTEDSSSDSNDESEKEVENVKKAENGHDSTSKKINKAFSARDESPEGERRVKMNRHGFEDVRTKGELLPEELPPLEELAITVDEAVEMQKVGTVKSIVGVLVVIQTCENIPPLNDDTILFLEGHKVLGQVFEVFGPVQAPWYSVRFNKEVNIANKGIEVGKPVYCAPKEGSFTSFVFVNSLKQMKGSDASWEDNNEPPDKYVEYSDDETERAAKSKQKKKKHPLRADQSGDCLPQMEKRSRNDPRQNDQSHHGCGRQNQQPGSYRPRNPFQGSYSGTSRPRHPGTNNPRHAYNPRNPSWGPPGQGARSGTPLPSFGGQPRFQQSINHSTGPQFVSDNTNPGTGIPRQSFQPGAGFGGNPRQAFGGNVRPGASHTGTFSAQGPQSASQTPPVSQGGLPWQKNATFRTDIPPPPFAVSNVQNRFSNPNSTTGPNTIQGQLPPNHNTVLQGNQGIAHNQFVVGTNSQQSSQVNSHNSFAQNVATNNSFPQNPTHNQFGNRPYPPVIQSPPPNEFRQTLNPAGQSGNNSNHQVQPHNSNNQFTNNFSVSNQNVFRGNTNQVPVNSNQTHPPPFQNGSNRSYQPLGSNYQYSNNFSGANQNMFQQSTSQVPANSNQMHPSPFQNTGGFQRQTGFATGNRMKIHSLNPGHQSNTPTRPVSGGYETVQLGSSTVKPYRPEILQRNDGVNTQGSR